MGSPTFPWAPSSSRAFLPLALFGWAQAAQGQSPVEVSGVLVAGEEDVQVRVDLRNTSGEPLVDVKMGGDLLGRHARDRLGDMQPGQTAKALLTFPYASAWRPGRHVLPLSTSRGGPPGRVPSRVDLLAYLILPLAASADPALRVDAPVVGLDLRSRLPVRLESADGQPHRARVRVVTPRGLVAPDPPPVLEVPAHGGVTVDVPLLQGAAPPDSRQGILIIAEALEGPIERMAVATSAVDIAPDPARLPRLRAPLFLLTLILLLAGGLAESRGTRS